MIRAEASYS